MDADAIVVGGGVSGLAAAWELVQRGHRVVLLEGATRPGGVVQTVERVGYRLELGPNTVLARPPLRALVGELGLDARVVPAIAGAGRRYIAWRGRLHPLPRGPLAALRSPLIGLRGVLQVLAEPFRPRGADPEESVRQLVSRRLGAAWVDRLVEPFVAGTFAGDAGALEAATAMRRLARLERESGSLVWGALRGLLSPSGPPGPRGLVTLDGGLGELVAALARAVGPALRVAVSAQAVEPRPGGWRVVSEGGCWDAPVAILAVPAQAAAALLAPWAAGEAAALAAVPHAGLALVHLGLPDGALSRPLDGFGLLVARSERSDLLGVLAPSQIFAGSAPPRHQQLVAFIGGALRPELVALDEADLHARVARELDRWLGLRAAPQWLAVTRYPEAIPQYVRGHGRFEDGLLRFEQAHPGLGLAGSYRGGISVPDRIEQGRLIAAQAAERGLGSPPTRAATA